MISAVIYFYYAANFLYQLIFQKRANLSNKERKNGSNLRIIRKYSEADRLRNEIIKTSREKVITIYLLKNLKNLKILPTRV